MAQRTQADLSGRYTYRKLQRGSYQILDNQGRHVEFETNKRWAVWSTQAYNNMLDETLRCLSQSWPAPLGHTCQANQATPPAPCHAGAAF
jgi:hypothetical protein